MMMASRAEGFGAEVKRRIMLGTFALSAGYADQYYNKALQVRRKIRGDFDAAFQEVDVLLGPTSPTPAFKLGERTADPLAMYLSDIYTITANLAGIPGLSIPCGLRSPTCRSACSFLAAPFAEETLLADGPGLRAGDRLAYPKRPGFGMMAGGPDVPTPGLARCWLDLDSRAGGTTRGRRRTSCTRVQFASAFGAAALCPRDPPQDHDLQEAQAEPSAQGLARPTNLTGLIVFTGIGTSSRIRLTQADPAELGPRSRISQSDD